MTGRGQILINAAHERIVFMLFALRPRGGSALPNVTFETFRKPLLAAHFRVDRVEQIVDGRCSVMVAAKIAGFFRRLARIIERPAALANQLAAPNAFNVDSVTEPAERLKFGIRPEPAL